MSKPKCIIVTGRPGSGKTTLSGKLSRRLWLPVVSRDAIKEGYVNTFSVAHNQLPSNTNGIVSDLFFDLVHRYLRGQISIIIEAAFQHAVWNVRMPMLIEASEPFFIVCNLDAMEAAERHLQRSLREPGREFYHGDARVSDPHAKRQITPPEPYLAPAFAVPTLRVATERGYSPSLPDIVRQIQAQVVDPDPQSGS